MTSRGRFYKWVNKGDIELDYTLCPEDQWAWAAWQEQEKKIEELEQQRDEAFDAMITFCKRVDNYEVISKMSIERLVTAFYAQFKAILEKAYGKAQERIKAGEK